MTLANYHAIGQNVSSDLIQHLSPVEKKLCEALNRVEVVGKRGNHVPVLMTSCVKQALDILVTMRPNGNVLNTNPFAFAKPLSDGHLRGSDVMRSFSAECGAKQPELLRGTRLRKHVATMSQLLNLKNNELDILAQFMGHDIRVHRHFYRLPSDILQTAKVAKILLAMEGGQQLILSGQSLDDVHVDLNEGNLLHFK
jgi:hypothetical protein